MSTRMCFFLILGILSCGDEARISASAMVTSPLTVDMLTVTVVDGDRRIIWNGSDFRPRPDNATPTTSDAALRTSGQDLTVEVRLKAQGVLLSQGSVSLPRRSDWKWRVDIIASTLDPRRTCFGCFGSTAFALLDSYRSVDHDSIWVVWGGNSISNPVVYQSR